MKSSVSRLAVVGVSEKDSIACNYTVGTSAKSLRTNAFTVSISKAM